MNPLSFLMIRGMNTAKFNSIPGFSRYGEKRTGRIPHEICRVGNETFDSIAEKDRYLELLVMEKAGIISELVCHPEFEIIPKQETPKGKPNFRKAVYTADFQYVRDGETIVEDVKSKYTREEKDYILRRKMMLYINGIYVEEIVR